MVFIRNLFHIHSFDFRFCYESHRSKDKVQLSHRLDSYDTIWLVALANEQFALIAGNRFHGISFS